MTTFVGDARSARRHREDYVGVLQWPILETPNNVEPTMRDTGPGAFGAPRGGGTRSHHGTDIVVPRYSHIGATKGGTVVVNEFRRDREGWCVVIEDDDHARHLYAHLQERSPLALGAPVNDRAFVGIVGSTGDAMGPHLHYQVQLSNGRFVNPFASLMLAAFVDGVTIQGVRADPVVSSRVGQDDANNRAWWQRLNHEAHAAYDPSQSFRWPDVVIDEAGPLSATRVQLRELRETYQRAMRTYFQAFTTYRAQGKRDEAVRVVASMQALADEWHRNVVEIERRMSATFVENFAENFDPPSPADIVAPVAMGLGVGLAVFAIGALVVYGSVSHA
jgi:hypothetical protein